MSKKLRTTDLTGRSTLLYRSVSLALCHICEVLRRLIF